MPLRGFPSSVSYVAEITSWYRDIKTLRPKFCVKEITVTNTMIFPAKLVNTNMKRHSSMCVTFDRSSFTFDAPLVVGAAFGWIQIFYCGEDKLRIRTRFNPFSGYRFPKPHRQISSRYKHQHHRNPQKLTLSEMCKLSDPAEIVVGQRVSFRGRHLNAPPPCKT